MNHHPSLQEEPYLVEFISKRNPTRYMGVVSRGAKCDISGCDGDGSRSINTVKVEGAGLRVESGGKKSVLCKQHYKEYKKETKEDRDLERARWS